MTENTDKKGNSPAMVPDKFTVKPSSGQRGMMTAIIVVDIALVALICWLAFYDEYFKGLFNQYQTIGWSIIALIVLDGLGSIFFAIKAGFMGAITVEGKTLSVGGRSYKLDEITGMERSGRGNKVCTLKAGSNKVCRLEDGWDNFHLLQRWLKQ
ncbi:MAG: hypothetical protein Q4F00_13040 [bacterium]|nr:hypothetical protein [bacterium]